ncbi:MAG: GspH/FimT family protein [Gemmatimonadota bacterium]|nr:GspH/FimT family protein [Gemmatimonadota bacterium]
MRQPELRAESTVPAPPRRAAVRRRRAARGFTVIELAITLGIAAILAAMALPAIDFNRYRMDANARLVQNTLLWAQARAVQRNMNVLVQFDYDRSQFHIVDDSTGDGAFTTGEVESYRRLAESMKFTVPPSTIDGQAAAYATGTGITTATYPTLTFYPNGSASGDAVIYLGSPRGRRQDYRAVKVTASTSKMYIYRMGANGIWSQSEL